MNMNILFTVCLFMMYRPQRVDLFYPMNVLNVCIDVRASRVNAFIHGCFCFHHRLKPLMDQMLKVLQCRFRQFGTVPEYYRSIRLLNDMFHFGFFQSGIGHSFASAMEANKRFKKKSIGKFFHL